MVKLRGINVWPEGVGEIAMSVPGIEPDYFVRAVREDNRDELILSVVGDPAAGPAVEAKLKDALGVKIRVEVVRPGELDELTEINTAPKPKRFKDER